MRVSIISLGLKEGELRHFFECHGQKTIQCVSLGPSSLAENASLVATVTFEFPSEAKKALDLNGRALSRQNVSVDKEFTSFTVLAAPPDPDIE